jgi:hypothetical protein
MTAARESGTWGRRPIKNSRPPWSVEEQGKRRAVKKRGSVDRNQFTTATVKSACFVVRDRGGQALAYVCFEEARRITVNVANGAIEPPSDVRSVMKCLRVQISKQKALLLLDRQPRTNSVERALASSAAGHLASPRTAQPPTVDLDAPTIFALRAASRPQRGRSALTGSAPGARTASAEKALNPGSRIMRYELGRNSPPHLLLASS